MQITAIGVVLILIGFIVFYCFQGWLYILTIFFMPFTATALINFSSGYWLTPFQYFGFMLILSESLTMAETGRIRLPPYRGLSVWLLFVFAGNVLLSSVMPIVIDGRISIQSPYLFESDFNPLRFSSRNFTTILYILFGIIIAILVAIKNQSLAQINLTLKVNTISGIFVSLWGWLQLVLYHLNIQYPYVFFNNSSNPVAQGFTQSFSGVAGMKINRISSVAVEPSIFAQYLYTVIPFVLFAVLMKRPVISRHADKFILFIMLSISLVSTSSTAYLGFFVSVMLSIFILVLTDRFKLRHAIIFTALFALCGILYFSMPAIRDFVDIFILSKMETDSPAGSGVERLLTIRHAWEYFTEYPILGTGWGSVTSHDLIVNLLANSGMFGLVSFATMVLYILGRLIRVLFQLRADRNAENSKMIESRAGGLVVAMVTLLIIHVLTGFTYGFGMFWFMLGLTIASYSVIQRKRLKTNDM